MDERGGGDPGEVDEVRRLEKSLCEVGGLTEHFSLFRQLVLVVHGIGQKVLS